MPNVIQVVRDLLLAESTITDLVGSRVYPDEGMRDYTKPGIVLWTTTSEAEDCLDGGVGFEASTIRVECVSNSRSQADQIWLEVNQALTKGVNRGTIGTTHVDSISQSGGHFHIADRPYDGSDRWLYRTIQSFVVSYHLYEK